MKDMPWEVPVIVHNEADVDKWSPVEMNWLEMKEAIKQELEGKGIPSDPEKYKLQLMDESGLIPFQIDRFHSDDPSMDTFVFRVWIKRHSKKTYFLRGFKEVNENENEENERLAKVELKRAKRKKEFCEKEEDECELRNWLFKVIFHLNKDALCRKGQSAGCASYMAIEHRRWEAYEVINPYNCLLEKKAMQIEKVRIYPPWTKDHYFEVHAADSDYYLVSIGNGPVRAFLNIRLPFVLEYEHQISSTAEKKAVNYNYHCNLYRYLLLYPHKYYVIERVKARAKKLEVIHTLYLFSIDVKFEDELNKNIISEKLKNTFKTKGFPLSKNVAVTKEKENEWAIANGEEFIVKKENGKLNIYDVRTEEIEIDFPLRFKLYYYLHADFGKDFGVWSGAPDWIAIGDNSEYGPFGYGFASNCGEKNEVRKCKPGDRNSGEIEAFFTLKENNSVMCLHKGLCEKNLYGDWSSHEKRFIYRFDNNIGDEWYDVIYTHLRGELGEVKIL